MLCSDKRKRVNSCWSAERWSGRRRWPHLSEDDRHVASESSVDATEIDGRLSDPDNHNLGRRRREGEDLVVQARGDLGRVREDPVERIDDGGVGERSWHRDAWRPLRRREEGETGSSTMRREVRWRCQPLWSTHASAKDDLIPQLLGRLVGLEISDDDPPSGG